MSSSARRDFNCSVCKLAFRRAEHLQRHMAIHSDGRPFDCKFCGIAFKRRDVVKRHMKTCRVRKASIGDGNETESSRSCLQCLQSEKECSGDYPCLSCQDETLCSYSTLDETWDPHQMPSNMDLAFADDWQSQFDPFNTNLQSDQQPLDTYISPSGHGLPASHDNKREFVTNLATLPDTAHFGLYGNALLTRYDTNAKDALKFFETLVNGRCGLADKFVCGTKAERQQALKQISDQNHTMYEEDHSTERSSQPYSEAEAWANWVSCVDTMMMVDGIYQLPHDTAMEQNLPNDLDNSPVDDHELTNKKDDIRDDPFTAKSEEIVERLKEVTLTRPRNSIIKQNWSDEIEQRCQAFFGPANLRRFLTMYWLFWYPNCSIIHRPTFDAIRSPATLLLSIALLGAAVSPEDEDRAKTKEWSDLAEEVVFGDEWLFEGTDLPVDTIPAGWRRLEALQAAFQICILQSWEGSDESWRRIRRHRFTFIVAVARDRAISLASHVLPDFVDQSNFVWTDFIMRETVIRTVTYILLLDTSFVIFTNTPPRMIVNEMDVELLCPEPCFQAATSEECLHHLQVWQRSDLWSRKLTISSAVALLCDQRLGNDALEEFVKTNVTNMLTCVLALHSLIFHLQASSLGQVDLSPCVNALQNWDAAWARRNPCDQWDNHHAIGSSPNELPVPVSVMWKRIGFMKHAKAYWTLASLALDRIKLQSGKFGTYEADNDRRGSVKFDDASMQQVSELVSSLRNLQVRS